MPTNREPETPFKPASSNAATQGSHASRPVPHATDLGAAPEADRVPPYFEREHRRLDRQFHEHLLAIAGGSFVLARQHVQRWRLALARHITIEDTRLLPHVPDNARWNARLYRLEHARITALAEAHAARVDAVSENPPRDERSTRETILSLLDAAQALRHVLEHHHQREEMALAVELPPALQAAAWGHGPGTQPHD